MIYRSNLESPDLAPHFTHLHSRPMAHSNGHDVLSDWADKGDDDPNFGLYKRCGFWTHDEAAILYNVARSLAGPERYFLDIGAHTGWTTAHMIAAGGFVFALEPLGAGVIPNTHPDWAWRSEVDGRFIDNIEPIKNGHSGHLTGVLALRSDEYFATKGTYDSIEQFACVVIDGDHDRPCPINDAKNAAARLAPDGVILFHDFIGRPVQEAVEYLIDHGFHCRTYWTPHMVACCWRGDFTPPVHLRDPQINWERVRQTMPDFNFERCE
jgi:hypothetical protein